MDNTGASIGLGASATVFASATLAATSTSSTCNYATANDLNTIAITSGTKFTFTPLVPADATGLNFTAVTPASETLNWTDVASNELGYAIYRSTDGTNYTFITQTAANATSSIQSSLIPSTTYFWKVYAVTEGALSNSLDGSQATTAPGNIPRRALADFGVRREPGLGALFRPRLTM